MKKFITILISFLIVQNSFVLASAPEIKTNDEGKKYYEEAKFKRGEINKPFYYIRHGETDSNKYGTKPKNLINNEVPLNDLGVAQVTKAAKLLKNKNIKIIVASPKLRTKQTAEIINKELNVPIIYFEGLIEAKRGKNKEIWESGGELEGAEHLYLFQKRIHDSIKEIVNKYDDVLIVGHGIYFRNFTVLLNDEYINPKNAEIFYLEPNDENQGKKLYKITHLLSK